MLKERFISVVKGKVIWFFISLISLTGISYESLDLVSSRAPN